MAERNGKPILPRFNFCRKGFSLAEALVTVALAGLVLSVFSLVITSMSRHTSSLDRKDQLSSAGFAALERLSRDVKMAVAWSTPALTDVSLVTSLEFDIPDYPNDAGRLPAYAPGIAVLPPWNPLKPSTLLHVRYQVSGSELRREILVAGVYEGAPLILKATGLSAVRSDRAEITVTLSIDQAPRAIQNLTQVVALPLPQAWRQP